MPRLAAQRAPCARTMGLHAHASPSARSEWRRRPRLRPRRLAGFRRRQRSTPIGRAGAALAEDRPRDPCSRAPYSGRRPARAVRVDTFSRRLHRAAVGSDRSPARWNASGLDRIDVARQSKHRSQSSQRNLPEGGSSFAGSASFGSARRRGRQVIRRRRLVRLRRCLFSGSCMDAREQTVPYSSHGTIRRNDQEEASGNRREGT